jgi:hypothetical protein
MNQRDSILKVFYVDTGTGEVTPGPVYRLHHHRTESDPTYPQDTARTSRSGVPRMEKRWLPDDRGPFADFRDYPDDPDNPIQSDFIN